MESSFGINRRKGVGIVFVAKEVENQHSRGYYITIQAFHLNDYKVFSVLGMILNNLMVRLLSWGFVWRKWSTPLLPVQLVGAIEYTNCISAER